MLVKSEISIRISIVSLSKASFVWFLVQIIISRFIISILILISSWIIKLIALSLMTIIFIITSCIIFSSISWFTWIMRILSTFYLFIYNIYHTMFSIISFYYICWSCKWYSYTRKIFIMKFVTLKSVFSNTCLFNFFKINKTKKIFSSLMRLFWNQSCVYKSRVWSKNMSYFSFGCIIRYSLKLQIYKNKLPSTYKQDVAFSGISNMLKCFKNWEFSAIFIPKLSFYLNYIDKKFT